MLEEVQAKIPAIWMEVLASIQQDYPQAVIAGGALRDLHNGRPIKDVDIFIPRNASKKWEWFLEKSAFGRLYSIENKFNVYDEDDQEEANKHDRMIYGVGRSMIGGIRFEFIMVELSETKIEMFDLNICQIGFDGAKVTATPAYFDGIKDKTIRIMNVNREDRQTKRIARLKEKYNDFAVDITTADFPPIGRI